MKMGRIKAILFDMDDTLVSTASTWMKAEARVYESLGSKYDPAIAVLDCKSLDGGFGQWNAARFVRLCLPKRHGTRGNIIPM